MIKALLLIASLALFSFCLAAPALCETPANAEDSQKSPEEIKKEYEDQKNRERERRRLEKQKELDRKDKEKLDKAAKDKAKDKEKEKPTEQQEALKKAEDKLQKGDINGSWAMFAALAKQDKDDAVAKLAAEQMKQIETDGQEEVNQALEAGDAAQAEKQLNQLYKKYWRTSVKSVLADATKEVRLKKAQSLADEPAAPKPDPNAPPPADAANTGDKQQENPDQIARMWLIIGDIHRLNGRPKEAQDAYDVLVDEYPDSRFAAEARNKIEQLRIEKADTTGGEQ